MDSDYRMGQGLGQNPENPKVIFPLKIACLRAGKEISARLRERAEPVKTRGTKRPARSQHHWPVCGFRRRSKETTPARPQASLGPFLRSVWRGSNPLRKTSRIRPVPRSVPRVGFPRETADNTEERNGAGESPDALCARPVTSTRSAGGFFRASNGAVLSWPIVR